MPERLSRRQIIQLLGLSALATGCALPTSDDAEGATDDTEDALSAEGALMKVDHFVVLMMENRSFDHYLGALQRTAGYPERKTVNGTDGSEWNPAPGTGKHVKIHKADTWRLKSPPHSMGAARTQWNEGKNDGFVRAYAGPDQADAMAFYDKTQIPFYYWLAENFTVLDNWHASVLGPTGPNRLYLNCGTSKGVKTAGTPVSGAEPETIWDQLRAKKISAASYFFGKAGAMHHLLPNKTAAHKIPFVRNDDAGEPKNAKGRFFKAAAEGTLPQVSFLEPDYSTFDDHPSKNIRLGQAFVHTIYRALAAGPKWKKTLFLVTYDEHGGFFDHVSPRAAPDDDPDFRRYGFRVPTFAAGGMVKRGHLVHEFHDHTSVIATLAKRFDLPRLTKRSAAANPILGIFDGRAAAKGGLAAPAMPEPTLIDAEALETVGPSSNEELEAAIDAGDFPSDQIDDRPIEDRLATFLRDAQEVGAVKLVQ